MRLLRPEEYLDATVTRLVPVSLLEIVLDLAPPDFGLRIFEVLAGSGADPTRNRLLDELLSSFEGTVGELADTVDRLVTTS